MVKDYRLRISEVWRQRLTIILQWWWNDDGDVEAKKWIDENAWKKCWRVMDLFTYPPINLLVIRSTKTFNFRPTWKNHYKTIVCPVLTCCVYQRITKMELIQVKLLLLRTYTHAIKLTFTSIYFAHTQMGSLPNFITIVWSVLNQKIPSE